MKTKFYAIKFINTNYYLIQKDNGDIMIGIVPTLFINKGEAATAGEKYAVKAGKKVKAFEIADMEI